VREERSPTAKELQISGRYDPALEEFAQKLISAAQKGNRYMAENYFYECFVTAMAMVDDRYGDSELDMEEKRREVEKLLRETLEFQDSSSRPIFEELLATYMGRLPRELPGSRRG